jgi:radical SAM superfamily enzyme YgiQ (UPF0313 family)
MQQTDIFLVSAPNRNIDYPALSLPTLYASLKRQFRVQQRDINMTIRDRLFTFEVLNCIKNDVLPELIFEYSSQYEIIKYFTKLHNYLLDVDKLWRLSNIEKIKLLMQKRQYDEIITDKEGSDGIQAIFKLNRMMHQFIEFYASKNTFISEIFVRTIGYDPISEILDSLYAEIIGTGAVIVGFAVLEIQRNFTLMLVRELKKKIIDGKSFSGHIVVGGADPTRYKEKYLEYFEDVDFVTMYEGEETFVQLMQNLLSGNNDFRSIKNIAFRENGQIVSTYDKQYSLHPSKIVSPDFTGFDIDKYLVFALPVHASRGCYYAFEKKHNCKSCSYYTVACEGNEEMTGCEREENGCNYCVHYKTYSNYIERDAISVVDDLQYLHNTYGVKLFHFTDDALKPTLGTAISDEIIKRGLTDIRWLVYARFEPEFDLIMLKKWYDAGARVIEWGLESASQNVINHMNKNIKISDVLRILKISKNIGLLSKLFLFHNHPNESIDDLRETLNCLLILSKNEQIRLFPVVRNKMYLLKGTTLYKNWEKFYEKIWKPSSDFGITAAYLEHEPYKEKEILIEEFVTQIRALMKTRMIYSTDDENVMFDLLTIQINESGNTAYYQYI